MRLASLFSLTALLAVAPAFAQDATQDVRLVVLQNDAEVGGTLQISVESRTSPERAPNTDLGSATIDVAYDADDLVVAGFTSPLTAAPGYNIAPSPITCSGLGGTCIRFTITTSGIGGPPFGNPGFEVGTEFTQLATLSFTLDAESAEAFTLLIDRATLSVGYFDSEDNQSGNGVIEDNTGTVGDDVVAFETVQDLSTRTVSYPSEDWHLVGSPGFGGTIEGLVGPLFTQGYPGSDAGEQGQLSVAYWNEETGAYVAPSGQDAEVPAGAGLFVYAFADDDFDGTDDPFPKTSLVTVEPVNDQGSPVNNAAFGPNPYEFDLPFSFPVTYTTGTGVPEGPGWNLLSNPADSTITWDDPNWTRTNMTDVFYTYDPAQDDYESWSAGVGGTREDGLIDPTVGFWARATAASPALVMPASAYNPAPAVAGRTAEAPAVRLRVSGDLGGSERTTEMLVTFADGGEDGIDRHDAYELEGLTDRRLQLFSRVGDEALDVDVRPGVADGPFEIDVEVDAVADLDRADLTLTWPAVEGFEPGYPVQLLDTETGAILDLRQEGSHTFSASTGAQARSAAGPLAAPRPRTLSAPTARADGSRFVLFVGSEAQSVDTEDMGVGVLALDAPAPNPTRSTARLQFTLAEAGPARLSVYDALGREVAVVIDESLAAGPHVATLASHDLAPGVYVVRLASGSEIATRSLTVVR